jgi:hypothetical protein
VSVALALLLAAASVGVVAAGAGPFRPRMWTRTPAVTVVSAAGDPRIPLVREAFDFWNRTFAEIGTPLRLGEVTLVTGSVPDADLQALGAQIARRAWRPALPAAVQLVELGGFDAVLPCRARDAAGRVGPDPLRPTCAAPARGVARRTTGTCHGKRIVEHG